MFKVGDIVTPNEKFLANWICDKFMFGIIEELDNDLIKLNKPITSKYYATNKIVSSSQVLIKYMRLVTNKELQLIRKEKLENICSK